MVLVIGSLGVGLGITLWLSTDAAERSYQLGNAREHNRVLLQQKEALERDVLGTQSAPALAEAARNLGMIPIRDTAHLVQDPGGNWMVLGVPRPAEGAPPPPLNIKLVDQPAVSAMPPLTDPTEVPIRLPRTGIPVRSRPPLLALQEPRFAPAPAAITPALETPPLAVAPPAPVSVVPAPPPAEPLLGVPPAVLEPSIPAAAQGTVE